MRYKIVSIFAVACMLSGAALMIIGARQEKEAAALEQYYEAETMSAAATEPVKTGDTDEGVDFFIMGPITLCSGNVHKHGSCCDHELVIVNDEIVARCVNGKWERADE